MSTAFIVPRIRRQRLLWAFIGLSAGVFLVVIGGMAYFFKQSVEAEVVDSVEKSSIVFARSVSNHIWPDHGEFIRNVPSLDPKVLQKSRHVACITRDIAKLLNGLPVLRIKIYNIDGFTVYSTSTDQIGESKSANPAFVAAALAGRTTSKITRRDRFTAISGEKFDVAVVESYVPLIGPDGRIEAVFETYTDATGMISRLDIRAREILLAGIFMFAVGFGAMLILVWRGNEVIRTQTQELTDAYADLSEKNRRLMLANDAKSDFFARISHDLRTPLNGIIGFSQILKDESFGAHADSRYREYSDNINSSGKQLLQLVDDMLDLSRVESGEYPLKIERLDLISLVDRVHKSLNTDWEARGLRFTVEGETAVPMVEGDRRATMHILYNLLSNAIRYSDSNEVIRVTLSRDLAAQKVTLAISDQGPGTDEVDLEKVLDPYFQNQTAYRSADRGGYGFGVSLAKSLIEMQGGGLRAEKTEDGVLTLKLDFKPADQATVH